ncbi:MAG: hypothetical protein AUG43_03145 [Actinobacteria bacterium 13_1_20CM_3_68_10]|nr:MAG: hypothetical protein AUG43_03145 [Actinobacteria bacterium 13_1_20CM_3_68_10]
MANRVGWFEVVGQDGEKLRSFYGDVFGWKFNVPSPEMNYGMTEDAGIGGGIGQAQGGPGHATFYVGVPDPQAALDKIEGAGGKTVVPVTEMEMVTFARQSPSGDCPYRRSAQPRSFGSTRSPSSICSSCSRYPACKREKQVGSSRKL